MIDRVQRQLTMEEVQIREKEMRGKGGGLGYSASEL